MNCRFSFQVVEQTKTQMNEQSGNYSLPILKTYVFFVILMSQQDEIPQK